VISYRTSAGLTQAKLAGKLGVTQGAVFAWESGIARPRKATMRKLEELMSGRSAKKRRGVKDALPIVETSAFGDWVRETRYRKAWSQRQLAREAGVTAVTISLLETGRIDNPHKKTRDSIVKALGAAPPTHEIDDTAKAARIAGLSELVDFDPHDNNEIEQIPPRSGVYVFYDISQRPIYVGESGDLRTRIKQHRRDKFWFRPPILQSASYFEVHEEATRKLIQDVLIKVLRSTAICNDQHTSFGE
jgi:transcriptional regulator with XRE-family HTH domain